MEFEHTTVEQAQSAPLRTLPMVRKARRPRRTVFRPYYDEYDFNGSYAFDGMDYDMAYTDAKNEYGFEMSVDDILSDFYQNKSYDDYVDDDTTLFDPPEYTPVREREYAPEVNSRYNLSFRREREKEQEQYTFNGREIDTGIEDDYIPPRAEEAIPSSWTAPEEEPSEYEEYDSFRESLGKNKRKLFNFSKKSGKKQTSYQPKYIVEEVDEEDEYAEGFRDVTGELHGYAAAADYAAGIIEGEGDGEEGYFPPTFKEYVASLFAAVFLKVRGSAKASSETMEDEEDLGTELSPAQASKYYAHYVHSAKPRLTIAVALMAIMVYLSLGFPAPGMLSYLPVTAAACMAMQFTIMLLALDVVTNGILKVFRLQFGADMLAVVACLFTSVDAAVVSTTGGNHLPLCAVSSLSLVAVLFSSMLSARGLRKAIRVPTIAKRIYTVTAETSIKEKDITLLKSSRSIKGFIRRCEEAAPDEALYNRLSPILLVAALVLAVIAAVISHNFHDFIYIASAILAPAVPLSALLCFALPFYMGSAKIFSSGGAIAGWSGLCDIGQSNNLIVTDRDLFPEGSVSIESIRVFADEEPEKVIAYAGSMMIASGSCLSKCFAEEMENNKCSIQAIDNFEYLSGGGMKGLIDGHVVLCGSSDLMRLMNVRFPFRLVDKTTVLLAIDGILYGIFTMKYNATPAVRKALVDLMRSNRHPIFALRDFNITPDMLKDTFDIATDGYDFPPYVERFKITETKPSDRSKIAAVVCREGLSALTNMADTGRSMYMATKLNLVLSALSAVTGMLAVFTNILVSGSISISFILMFMLISALPVLMISVFMKF